MATNLNALVMKISADTSGLAEGVRLTRSEISRLNRIQQMANCSKQPRRFKKGLPLVPLMRSDFKKDWTKFANGMARHRRRHEITPPRSSVGSQWSGKPNPRSKPSKPSFAI